LCVEAAFLSEAPVVCQYILWQIILWQISEIFFDRGYFGWR
jgi:hypothetical protein